MFDLPTSVYTSKWALSLCSLIAGHPETTDIDTGAQAMLLEARQASRAALAKVQARALGASELGTRCVVMMGPAPLCVRMRPHKTGIPQEGKRRISRDSAQGCGGIQEGNWHQCVDGRRSCFAVC